VIDGARPRLDTLASELEARRRATTAVLTPTEWDDVIQFVNVMRHAALRRHRDRYMAENLAYVIDHEAPGTKFIVWAHNDHITEDSLSLGYFLRQRYGDAYYALALYVNEGTYLTRSIRPLGDFEITTKPPSTPASLESFLVRADLPCFFLDLRASPGTPAVDAWLHTPREAYGGVWAYQQPATLASLNDTLKVREWYDGLVFVKQSSPTHPTSNARRIVERRESF
jgi:erythromycin esterase